MNAAVMTAWETRITSSHVSTLISEWRDAHAVSRQSIAAERRDGAPRRQNGGGAA